MSNRSAVARLSILFRRLAARVSKRSREALSKKDSADTSTLNTPSSNSVQISWKILLKILLKILPTIRERSVEW